MIRPTRFYMAVWHGLWAPKGTPADVITKLNAVRRAGWSRRRNPPSCRLITADHDPPYALADSSVRARLVELGQEISALDQQSPQALGVFQKAEIEKWWPLIKPANIKGG